MFHRCVNFIMKLNKCINFNSVTMRMIMLEEVQKAVGILECYL